MDEKFFVLLSLELRLHISESTAGLKAENAGLKTENAGLKAENEELRRQLQEMQVSCYM